MDVLKVAPRVRARPSDLGRHRKRAVAWGPEAIDAELARVRPLIEEGGYVPAPDHSFPARYAHTRISVLHGAPRNGKSPYSCCGHFLLASSSETKRLTAESHAMTQTTVSGSGARIRDAIFISAHVWEANRPRILIVACSDGRYQQSLDEFLANHLASRITIGSTCLAARAPSHPARSLISAASSIGRSPLSW